MGSQLKMAERVSVTGIIINGALSVLKLAAGALGHSGALISDGVDSLGDVAGSVIAMTGIRLSERKADKGHPYGHERFECVATLLLSFMLALAGIFMARHGVMSVVSGDYAASSGPAALAAAAACVSIAGKLTLSVYTFRRGRELRVSALIAAAENYRADVFVSVGSLVGIAGARLGLPVLDPVMETALSAMVLWSAVSAFREAIGKMTDRSCDEATNNAIYACAAAVEGVMSVDLVRTRQFGSRFYVDVEVSADPKLELHDAHAICQHVHDSIESAFPEVKHCMVHINPYGENEEE
ncbi:MAG: cation diffusion facilitator family transporter [Oscillospiraceae bacterium]|nr:cation diffusion facilitator family transporter [Oscillospiraceae bacterium]